MIGLVSLRANRNRWHDEMQRKSALAKAWAQRSADSSFDGPTYAALHARLAVRYARLVRAADRLIATTT